MDVYGTGVDDVILAAICDNVVLLKKLDVGSTKVNQKLHTFYKVPCR